MNRRWLFSASFLSMVNCHSENEVLVSWPSSVVIVKLSSRTHSFPLILLIKPTLALIGCHFRSSIAMKVFTHFHFHCFLFKASISRGQFPEFFSALQGIFGKYFYSESGEISLNLFFYANSFQMCSKQFTKQNMKIITRIIGLVFVTNITIIVIN